MPAKILFVDDDPNILAAFRRNLRNHFAFDTAVGGEEAIGLIRSAGPYAVVVADMTMPTMNGIELIERVREISPDTVPVMLTGNSDQQTAIESVNRGRVFRFLNKPCPVESLVPAIEAALQHHELKRNERELLEGTLTGCVKLLTDILGSVAPDALGRGQRLRLSISRFVRHRKLEAAWECEIAALLSAIGYAAVPPSILQKLSEAEPLSVAEERIVRQAPEIGYKLLADIPRLRAVAEGVRYQRKHFDGTGFPEDERSGEAIPLAARLLRIFADRLELEADGVVKERALQAMTERAGFYDPQLLAACFEVFPSFLPNAIAADRAVGSVAVAQLEPGMVLVADLGTYNGLVLVAAGHALTTAMIERIRNFAELGEVKEPILVQEAVEEAVAAA
jgi:response regulator RpfG family c-di-GMP phosphodiesterase